MADIAETILWRASIVGVKFLLFKGSSASENDTITLGEMTTITSVKAWRTDTGANITCSSATNVVTITESGLSDKPVIGFATGYE